MTNVIFAGNAVTAHILCGYLRNDRRYNIMGCVVDDAFAADSEVPELVSVGISVVLDRFNPRDCKVLMATGYDQANGVRMSLFERLRALGYAMETYIHPQAMIHTDNHIGDGSVIMPGALVEPGAVIGCDSFIWGNVVVAHDAIVGKHSWLAAGAVVSGMAKVGDCCFVGVNATIANKVEVGDGSIIGGAAFITKKVKQGSVMLARSAEPFRCNAKEYARYFGL